MNLTNRIISILLLPKLENDFAVAIGFNISTRYQYDTIGRMKNISENLHRLVKCVRFSENDSTRNLPIIYKNIPAICLYTKVNIYNNYF